jgi:hypothetical protein
VAKAIADDRQIDLPISNLFWKLCMSGGDAQLSLFDMKELKEDFFNTLAQIQICANQASEVFRMAEEKSMDEESKKKLLE